LQHRAALLKEKTFMPFTLAMLFAFALIALAPGSGNAAPTPVPGGANAVSALSGKLGDTVFNGVLRIKVVALREATDFDNPSQETPSADQKVMVMQTVLHNGKQDRFTDLVTYTLADSDAVSFEIPSYKIKNINPSILQGAAVRQSAVFVVDKDFKPVKLIIQCSSCSKNQGFRPVRFTLPEE
jgi:hypothetical protein